MKKTILAVMLSCMACHAMAADTAEMKVQGTLINAACTPSLDKNEVDYGNILTSRLNVTGANQLGSKDVTLTITCDNSMTIGWSTVDGHKDSLQSMTVEKAGADNSDVTDAATEYGLGKAGDVKIGAFTLSAKTTGVTYDGTAGDLLESDNAGVGTNWAKSTKGVTKPGTRVFTVGTTGSVAPKEFKIGIFPLKVSAAVQDATTLNITDDTALDGLATISLSYI